MHRGCTVVLVSMLVAGTVHASPDRDKQFPEKNDPKFMRGVQWNLCVAGNYLVPPYSGVEDEATRAALAKFARDKGIPVPLAVDEASFHALTRAVDSLYPQSPVSLPSAFFSADRKHLIAAGTWIGLSDLLQLNTVHISCTRAAGCQIAETSLLAKRDGTFMLGHPTVAHRPVMRWNDFEIVTVPEDTKCVRTVVRIMLATKTVTQTFLRRQASSRVDCSWWPEQRVMTLVDGLNMQVADEQKRWDDFLRTKRPECGALPRDQAQ